MMSNESLDVSDFTALTQLFEEFRPRLTAMLRRRIDPALAQRVDAEDVLADAYLVARNRWKKYAENRKVTPYAWLYRIALDQLFETWRRETRSKRDL